MSGVRVRGREYVGSLSPAAFDLLALVNNNRDFGGCIIMLLVLKFYLWNRRARVWWFVILSFATNLREL